MICLLIVFGVACVYHCVGFVMQQDGVIVSRKVIDDPKVSGWIHILVTQSSLSDEKQIVF